MNKVWLVVVLAVTVIALGCGAGGSAESAAKKILEATKTGDADTILDHMDLKGMYESLPEMARGGLKYEDWEKKTREQMKKMFEPNPEFEYEIISCKEEGDTATLKTKTKEHKDSEWEERETTLKKIDGTWKITADSFGGMGGPEE
jgi:ketosteroid isomerase-like protein